MATKTIKSTVARQTAEKQQTSKPATTAKEASARRTTTTRKPAAKPAAKATTSRSRTTKPATKPADVNPDLTTKTKKSFDDMTEAHRKHIERWEPIVKRLGIDHVWANSSRFAGRGDGPQYLLLKVKAKHYRIVSIDTSDPKDKGEVLVDDLTSPKTGLEAFREYRKLAQTEREASRKTSKAQAKAAEKAAAVDPAAHTDGPAPKKPARTRRTTTARKPASK